MPKPYLKQKYENRNALHHHRAHNRGRNFSWTLFFRMDVFRSVDIRGIQEQLQPILPRIPLVPNTYPPLQEPRYTSNGNASALNRRPAPMLELSVMHDLPPSHRETAARTYLHLLFPRFKRYPGRDRSDYCTLMSCKVTKTTTTTYGLIRPSRVEEHN